MTVIETKLDDEKEVFSLENLSRFLLKHEETLNNKVLITTPKEPFVALGPMKPHFKKKSHNQKKGSHAPTMNFKKGANKKNIMISQRKI